ncbi:MAG TPA: DUF1684 domain-containing protein [Anaerolineales bacterium]|nr:DUF1684 domain-containing protein [Anaerolineales bacterium]
MTDLEAFRHEKDDFFQTNPYSPLTPEQQRDFAGLRYFPEDPGLRLKVPVERFDAPDTIRMQTSTGDVQAYERFGRFRLTVDGQEAAMTIYRNENGYFLPFVDSLAGKETYGAGRYLEPEEQPDGTFVVDFNLAYNPYCAYNENWSCPITPAENRVKVPIRAGEKMYLSGAHP